MQKPVMNKKALALSGGGPAVGIEIGALRAFEEKGIDFDIFTCACVGSWVGCLYNSLSPGPDRIKQLEDFFFEKIFIPDDIYESFPICYKVFRVDYFGDMKKYIEKFFDPATYQHLFLADRIMQYFQQMQLNPPATNDEINYYISEGMAINPFARWFCEMIYKVKKSGIAGLVNSADFVEENINMEDLFKSGKLVYLNAYNMTKTRLERFVNRRKHKEYDPISAEALMAGSSVLEYTENRTIGGGPDKYCEGAVINTVELNTLLEHDHKDEIEEIWVVKIADYQEAKPPKNLIEAALTAVMLPFDTISDDDIEIFSHHLTEVSDREKTRLIKINMNYGAVNYHWNHSNLKEGIRTGYEGTIKAIEEYEAKKKQEVRSRVKRKPVIDLLTPPKAMRGTRWSFDDEQK
ncbi:MAG: patatin-like phospholipase family protein [Smithella sp.]|jgi:predicted acylesterase/phospholipase RssA